MAATDRRLCNLAWRLTAAMAHGHPARVVLRDGQVLHGPVQARHAAERDESPWLRVTIAGQTFDVSQALEVAV